jgi:hypothetical protein
LKTLLTYGKNYRKIWKDFPIFRIISSLFRGLRRLSGPSRNLKRPLQNAPFCPIPASGSNFNPQNTLCIPVVKIFALTRGVLAPRPCGQLDSCPILLSCRIVLGLEPRLNIKYRFNWAGKIGHFSKVSRGYHANL